MSNLTGQPAPSVPAGFSRGGLPIGVQLAGATGSEAVLLSAAAEIEAAPGLVAHRPSMLAGR
jgi:Asp-tRNA(Asn)/Glu-tRNA(Gln) amidotransferase A subunit family amidase